MCRAHAEKHVLTIVTLRRKTDFRLFTADRSDPFPQFVVRVTTEVTSVFNCFQDTVIRSIVKNGGPLINA